MVYLVVVLIGAIGALFGVASRKPATYTVTRSTHIDAPPEQVFPLINNFRRWEKWSPFEKLDAAMKKTYSGADEGAGSKYAWVGNKKAGVGSMEIRQSTPSSEVTIDMSFLKPFKSTSMITFTIEPVGAASKVTWAMNGQNQLISKVMSVFVSMDKLIGKDFVEGLANLKREVEQSR